MILVDFSPLIISNFFGFIRNKPEEISLENMDIIRRLTFSTITDLNHKFRSGFGRMVFAVDSPKGTWRKDIFPYYKASRKEQREKDLVNLGIDWEEIINCINTIKEELIEFFPYYVIEVEKAEADDVIGVLTYFNIENGERTLIISRDKDFFQLQVNTDLVQQYDLSQDRMISVEDPKAFIFEQVLRGDRVDGIPNILSPEDSFVTKTRQKPLTQKLINELLQDKGSLKENPRYELNKRLIVLKYTPKEIKDRILEKFNDYTCNDNQKILSYLQQHGLKKLFEQMQNF